MLASEVGILADMFSPEVELLHAIDPSEPWTRHNLGAGKGRILSIGFARAEHPDWAGIMSPYEACTGEREKEQAFEAIRASSYPGLPSRLGCLFCFPSRAHADEANRRWWNGRRVVLPAQVVLVPGMKIGVFDAAQLDAYESDWPAAAHRYWRGEKSVRSLPEVVIQGVIQLAGWEPYGELGAFARPAEKTSE